MHTLGTTVLLAGMLVMILAQVYGAVRTFKVEVVHGILCFIIPGYLLFIAKRHGFYGWVVGIWFGGILGMVLGTVLLS